MSKTILITGASSGIGLAIAEKFLEKKFLVIGIARDFSGCKVENDNFIRIECDISDSIVFEKRLCDILSNYEINVLVNNAGLAYFAPHEELNSGKIIEMITVNLTAPMLACRVFLRKLKKNTGHIVNISSVTATMPSPFAAVYGATKAGLSSFSKSLLEEGRKTGLKVTVVHPDIVKSNFYKNAFFSESDDPQAYLSCETVADAVVSAVLCDNYTIISEITLIPEKKQIKRKKN